MSRLWNMMICFIDILSAIIFIFLVFFVILQVFLRYFWGLSFSWGIEFSSFLLLWIVFFGSIVLVHQDGHVKIETINNHLSPKWNSLRKLIINILILAFLVMLFFQSIVLFRTFVKIPSECMRISLGFFFIAIILFSAFSCIEYMYQIFRLFKAFINTKAMFD